MTCFLVMVKTGFSDLGGCFHFENSVFTKVSFKF